MMKEYDVEAAGEVPTRNRGDMSGISKKGVMSMDKLDSECPVENVST